MHFLSSPLLCCDLSVIAFALLRSLLLLGLAEASYYASNLPQQQFPRMPAFQPPPPAPAMSPLFGRQQQLIIYDPFTGRQMLPFQYLPLALSANNRPKPLMVSGNLVELPKLWNPCSCSDYMCMCCIGLGFGSTYNDRVCVSLSYNAAQVALQMRIDHNQYTIANLGFSVRNPPDYCVPLLLPLPVFSCLRLYDVRTLANGNVQICTSVVLKVFANQIYEYHFDCVRFGGSGVHFVKRSELDDDDDGDDAAAMGDEEDILLSANFRPLDYSGNMLMQEQQQQQQHANDKINDADFLRL